uniref:Ig-like domain-containing protein n=1 Tax=Oryzias latipes TaxID=8090 RepID=A0A3P9K0H0_ORYLA
MYLFVEKLVWVLRCISLHLTRPEQNKVSQTPTDVLVKANSEVTLTLSHKIPNYDTVLWYRRSPGDSLVVFTSTANRGEHDFGAFSKEKFSATKTEAERGTFTVKEVQPEDKGLYFCAVSQHSDTNP